MRTLGGGLTGDFNKRDSTTVEEVSDSYDQDLHGGSRAGQHAGVGETRTYPAYDVKELHQQLTDFENDELRRIPVLAEGERLEQGAVYFDLGAPEKGVFTAMGDMEAENGHLYVPKALLDYELWNKLTGGGGR